MDAGSVTATELLPRADALGQALHFLRLSGTFYCHAQVSEPWGITVPALPDYLWFHVVTSGRCQIEVDGAGVRALRPGQLALVPHGRGHRLRSEPGAPVPDVIQLPHEYFGDRYAVLRHGGGGAAGTLLCGGVRFDHPAARELVVLLPRLLHLDASRGTEAEWLQATLRLIAAESTTLRPGGETVITRLSDILVIQAIRAWIEDDPAAQTGWLGALRDPQIGHAISLIHRHPARSWTLASLAAEVAMSRSAFAARFTQVAGEPVMGYLTRWRMHLAREQLRDGAAVGELAGRLGYHSIAAFSRAFKRVHGMPPSTIKQQVEPPGIPSA